jgi:hypothetical protein
MPSYPLTFFLCDLQYCMSCHINVYCTLQLVSYEWPVKPLVKRPGRLTHARPRLGRISNCMAYPLFRRRSAGSHPPLPPLAGEGGGMVVAGPSPIPSLELAVVVCRVSCWSVTCGTLSNCFRLCSFLFAHGNPVSGGIHEWLALPTCAIHRMPSGLSLILDPGAFPQLTVFLFL